jgi:hypothetical protein
VTISVVLPITPVPCRCLQMLFCVELAPSLAGDHLLDETQLQMLYTDLHRLELG